MKRRPRRVLTLRGRGRGESRAVGRKARVVDQEVKLGAATRVGAQRAVLVEVQLTRIHHLSGEQKSQRGFTTVSRREEEGGGTYSTKTSSAVCDYIFLYSRVNNI